MFRGLSTLKVILQGLDIGFNFTERLSTYFLLQISISKHGQLGRTATFSCAALWVSVYPDYRISSTGVKPNKMKKGQILSLAKF